MTAAEAFLLHMAKSGLAGNGAAARAAMAALATARAARGGRDGEPLTVILLSFISSENAIAGLRRLNMVRTLDPHRPSARIRIEPWLVQAAVDRLRPRQLTLSEQAEVWRATRTPAKVQWPSWWELTAELLATLPIPPPAKPEPDYDRNL